MLKGIRSKVQKKGDKVESMEMHLLSYPLSSSKHVKGSDKNVLKCVTEERGIERDEGTRRRRCYPKPVRGR